MFLNPLLLNNIYQSCVSTQTLALDLLYFQTCVWHFDGDATRELEQTISKKTMTSFKATLVALAVATSAVVAAPITFTGSTFESRQLDGNAGPLGSASAYKAYFNTLTPGGAGYGTAALPTGTWNPLGFSVSTAVDVSNHGLVGGTTVNLAYHYQVNFNSVAGSLSAQMAPDFGLGGGVLLDGVGVALNASDMWWSYSWAATSQIFTFSKSLAAGGHTIDIYGQERCCDGFTGFDASFTATPDNGATLAFLGLGLAGVAVARRSFKA